MATSNSFTPSESQLQTFSNDIFQPIFVGFIFQQILLGVIISLACSYSTRSKLNMCLVSTLLFLNVFEVGLSCDVVGRTSVIETVQTWTWWAQPGVTAVIVFLVHSFLVKRACKLTERPWLVCLFLVPLSLLCLGFGLASSILLTLSNADLKPVDLAGDTIPVVLSGWLTSTFLTDVMIVLVVVSIMAKQASREAVEVSLGFVGTSLMAIFTLLLFRWMPDSTDYLGVQFSISRLHTITVLMALRVRGVVAQTDCPSTLTDGPSMEEQNMEITIMTLVGDDVQVTERNRSQDSAV